MKPKILVLSTLDRYGAGLYALEIHKLLVGSGYHSRMYVKEKSSNRSDIIAYKRTFFHKVVDRLYRYLSPPKKIKTKPDYHFYGHLKTSFFPTFRTVKQQIGFKPDVVLIFWVSDFITNEIIEQFHQQLNAKVVFFTPDAALFTGGCHYPNGCTNYRTGCFECPAISSENQRSIASKVLSEKAEMMKTVNAIILSGSSYLTKLSNTSLITRTQNIIELFGMVDEEEFFPVDRQEATKRMGLSPNTKYVLLAAAFLNQRRKGISEAITALNQVWAQYQDFEVILLGNNSEEFMKKYHGAVQPLGYIDASKLNDLYNVSHFYLCPSLEDAGPMMVNQSLMAGTPVVGFRVGVLNDLIVDGETGYLSDTGDIMIMGENVMKVLQMTEVETTAMRVNCRQLALSSYSKEEILKKITSIIDKA